MRPIVLLIFTAALVLCGCSSRRTESAKLINHGASLPETLPLDPLKWRVIAASVNTKDATMSTLFGNDIAVTHARTSPNQPYPAGSILSLVTWTQQEDQRWFGAKIPDGLKSVEFVTVLQSLDVKPSYSYELYAGSPLLTQVKEAVRDSRINEIVRRRALVMP